MSEGQDCRTRGANTEFGCQRPASRHLGHGCPAEWFGSDALELTYETGAGKVANELLYSLDDPPLAIVGQGRPWSFDRDGRGPAEPGFRPFAAPCGSRVAGGRVRLGGTGDRGFEGGFWTDGCRPHPLP